jgi:hypothetical protein
MRNGSDQFVSGVRFPPLEESQSGAVEVEFKGPVGSLNPASQYLKWAGLALDVFVTPSTGLEGAKIRMSSRLTALRPSRSRYECAVLKAPPRKRGA